MPNSDVAVRRILTSSDCFSVSPPYSPVAVHARIRRTSPSESRTSSFDRIGWTQLKRPSTPGDAASLAAAQHAGPADRALQTAARTETRSDSSPCTACTLGMLTVRRQSRLRHATAGFATARRLRRSRPMTTATADQSRRRVRPSRRFRPGPQVRPTRSSATWSVPVGTNPVDLFQSHLLGLYTYVLSCPWQTKPRHADLIMVRVSFRR